MKGDTQMKEVKNQAKQKIKMALISLMLDNRLESITITDITKEANVNRSTYYYYYYQKEEILNEIINQCTYDLVKVLKSPYHYVSEIEINQHILSSSINLFEHVYQQKYYYKVLLNSESAFTFQNKFIEVLVTFFLHETNPIYVKHDSNNFINREIETNYHAYGILGMIKNWGNNNYFQTPRYMAEQLTYLLCCQLEKIHLIYNLTND